jgi:hypothetical protein
MNRLICACLVSMLALSAIPNALAWRGGGGGGAYHGAYGGAAVKGPGGNWAAEGPRGSTASGNSHGSWNANGYRGGTASGSNGQWSAHGAYAGRPPEAVGHGPQPITTARRLMAAPPTTAIRTTAARLILTAQPPPVWPLAPLRPRPTDRPITGPRAAITPIQPVIISASTPLLSGEPQLSGWHLNLDGLSIGATA